jgi:glutamyl/glutaminyl-tRNA synthetase
MTKEVVLLKDKLSVLNDFSHIAIEQEFRGVCDILGIKVKILVHPVRVALMGRRNGPGLFESMEVLGKDKTIIRLQRLIDHWANINDKYQNSNDKS